MENQKGKNALFVVFVIAVASYFASKEQNSTKITLPQDNAGSAQNNDNSQAEAGFVVATKENAAALVASLYRPRAYHQTLTRKTAHEKNNQLHSGSAATAREKGI